MCAQEALDFAFRKVLELERDEAISANRTVDLLLEFWNSGVASAT